MERKPFSEWPSKQDGSLRILLANRPELRRQGMAAATEEELGNSIMIFDWVNTQACFDNLPHEYGPVKFDIEIAYISEDGKVLKIDPMKAETGKSQPDAESKIAVEAKSGWFHAVKIKCGDIFAYDKDGNKVGA